MPRHATKTLVNQCSGIDVVRWQREGRLIPGRAILPEWRWHGQLVARATIHVERDRLTLWFRTRLPNGAWTQTKEEITLIWTPCRFGGERPFFVCTARIEGRGCGRHVTKLYRGGEGRFACRRCLGLSYLCQREPLEIRGVGVAQKIRERLGGHPGLAYPFPSKPRGMHWRTYDRLKQQHDEIDHRCLW
jgi:hypothetical protein